MTYRADEDVTFANLGDGDSVLLNTRTRQYYSINDTGTRIWELLVQGVGERQIVAALTKEWDVDETEAERYVSDFLNVLGREGLIQKAVQEG